MGGMLGVSSDNKSEQFNILSLTSAKQKALSKYQGFLVMMRGTQEHSEVSLLA